MSPPRALGIESRPNLTTIPTQFPTVVETLGFNTTITLVLTCPPYVTAGAVSVAVSWSSGRFNERTWHITVSKLVAIFGFVLGSATLNMGTRYFAMVVFAVDTYGVNSIILGWVGATCGQSPEKKPVALSIVNTVANISFIWTPVMFDFWEKPSLADDTAVPVVRGGRSSLRHRHGLECWV